MQQATLYRTEATAASRRSQDEVSVADVATLSLGGVTLSLALIGKVVSMGAIPLILQALAH